MKLLFFLASFCISLIGFSQKGDYLVKTNGDTVWGTIKLNRQVFYVNGTSSIEILADDVAKIKSVNYKGNTVVHCNLLLYTENLAELDIDYIKKGNIDTVLILDEIYATPKINLYYVVNDFKLPFYFYKTPTDPKPVQLVIRYFLQGGLDNYERDRARYRGDRSRVQLAEDKGYVNQLRAIMGNCNKIPEPMWEMLSYRDYSLKKVIKKYNKCN
jgi:hypothetical protein